MKKRVLTLFLVIVLVVPMMVGGNRNVNAKSSTNGGKVFRIYSYNEEMLTRMETIGLVKCDKKNSNKGTLKTKYGKMKFEYIITPTTDGDYQKKLKKDLKNNKKASDKNKVDLYLIEADYASDYIDSNYSLDLGKLGIDANATKDMYSYTKKLMTNKKDKTLRAATWQVCPGVFMYRRSFAQKVLGTDEPKKVQKYVSNWKKFDQTAAKMEKKGYAMLTDPSENFGIYNQQRKKAWVKGNKIQIDPVMMDWVKQMKKYSDNGYFTDGTMYMWTDDWDYEMSKEGVTFGFFFPRWGVNYIANPNSLDDNKKAHKIGNGSFGDWAVCKGPASYFWGGSFMCIATGSDNQKMAAEIIKEMASLKAGKKLIKLQDLPNNKKAVATAQNLKNDFLNNQKEWPVYDEAAKNIPVPPRTKYDSYISEMFEMYMRKYIVGNYSKKEALNMFYKSVKQEYPNLKR